MFYKWGDVLMDDKMIKNWENALLLSRRISLFGIKYSEADVKLHIVIALLYYLGYENQNIKNELPLSIIGEIDKRNSKHADLCLLNAETKKIEIIIECKKSGENLDDSIEQLKCYMYRSDDVKIGILINATTIKFYVKHEDKNIIKLIEYWNIDISHMSLSEELVIEKCRESNNKLLETLVIEEELRRTTYVKRINNGYYTVIGETYQPLINMYSEKDGKNSYVSTSDVQNTISLCMC